MTLRLYKEQANTDSDASSDADVRAAVDHWHIKTASHSRSAMSD